MRFHCFDIGNGSTIHINLDGVAAVAPSGQARTLIYAGKNRFSVLLPVEDVLRLISPPAAPDTYEEGLAKHMEALRKQRDYPKPPTDSVILRMGPPGFGSSNHEEPRMSATMSRLDELFELEQFCVRDDLTPRLRVYLSRRRWLLRQSLPKPDETETASGAWSREA